MSSNRNLLVYDSAVLAFYTKSACQTSNECHYKREVNHDTFTVKLNVTEEPGGEYYCYPDVQLPRNEVHACVATKNNQSNNQSKSKSIVLTVVLGETNTYARNTNV